MLLDPPTSLSCAPGLPVTCAPKRVPIEQPDQYQQRTSRGQASEAISALQTAHRLKEEGYSVSAWRWVEHAMDQALLAHPEGQKLYCDEACVERLMMSGSEPPAALIVSVGLAALGSLAHDDEDLEEARTAFEESLKVGSIILPTNNMFDGSSGLWRAREWYGRGGAGGPRV